MHKKISWLGAVFGLSMLTLSAPQAQELKVGVVDIARVLEGSPQAQAAQKTLETEFGPREKELLATRKKLRQKEERMTRDASIMSESERARLERDVLALRRDLKHQEEAMRDDLNLRRNELLANLQRQVIDSIRAYAKEQKLDLLLAEGVLYANEKLDVTDQILDRLSK